MKCPICDIEMESTYNADIVSCPQQDTFVPSLEETVRISHASIYVNPETKKPEIISLEIGPYDITIWDQVDDHRTDISKIDWRDSGPSRPNQFTNKLITLPKALHLPWHDTNEVMERIRMYLLFS